MHLTNGLRSYIHYKGESTERRQGIILTYIPKDALWANMKNSKPLTKDQTCVTLIHQLSNCPLFSESTRTSKKNGKLKKKYSLIIDLIKFKTKHMRNIGNGKEEKKTYSKNTKNKF